MQMYSAVTSLMAFVTSLIVMVSILTNHWVEIDGGKSFAGLFQFCLDGECQTDRPLKINFKGVVQTTLAYMVMGLVTLVLSLSMWLLETRDSKESRLIPGTFFTTFSCIFLLVACCVFTEVKSSGQEFGYSYGLAWASFGMTFFMFLVCVYRSVKANIENGCCNCVPQGSSTI